MAKNEIDPKFDYTLAARRLEEIVATLQATDVTVDDALKLYEEGMGIVHAIEQYLAHAEHVITKLTIKQ